MEERALFNSCAANWYWLLSQYVSYPAVLKTSITVRRPSGVWRVSAAKSAGSVSAWVVTTSRNHTSSPSAAKWSRLGVVGRPYPYRCVWNFERLSPTTTTIVTGGPLAVTPGTGSERLDRPPIIARDTTAS